MRLLKKGVQIGVSMQLSTDKKSRIEQRKPQTWSDKVLANPARSSRAKIADSKSPILGQSGNTIAPTLYSVTGWRFLRKSKALIQKLWSLLKVLTAGSYQLNALPRAEEVLT